MRKIFSNFVCFSESPNFNPISTRGADYALPILVSTPSFESHRHVCYVHLINLYWHELWKQEKCSSLAPPRGLFFYDSMSFTGCQMNPIDVNFHLQKCFDKNSANKIWSLKDKEIKVSPLIPIRVKYTFSLLACHKKNYHTGGKIDVLDFGVLHGN